MKRACFLWILLPAAAGLAGLASCCCSSATGSKDQEAFYTKVSGGSPASLMATFHPALVEKVDEPVLALWMEEVNDKLGKFKSIDMTNFNTSTKSTDKGRLTETTATVNFEKGPATSQLKFLDGRVIAFYIKSDLLDKGFYKNLKDTKLYQERGEENLRRLLDGKEDAAFEAMHESLQKKTTVPKLREMMASVRKKAGPLKSIAFKKAETGTESGEHKLVLLYEVVCEKDATVASVTFQFADMMGHFTGFDFTHGK